MTREEFVDRWSQGFPGLAEEPFEFVRALDALLDAERAKAREEQRAVDVGACMRWFDGRPPPNSSPTHLLHAESLTATPLADRIAELERERDEAVGDAEAYAETLSYLSEVGAQGHDLQGDAMEGIGSLVEQRDEARDEAAEWKARAEKAEAERDEWKARALKAEETLAELRDQADAVEKGCARP